MFPRPFSPVDIDTETGLAKTATITSSDGGLTALRVIPVGVLTKLSLIALSNFLDFSEFLENC